MKYRFLSLFMLMTILIAGCSISLGDGEKLEITTDGVNKVASEKIDTEKNVEEEEADLTEKPDEYEADESTESKEGKPSLADQLATKQDCENDYEDLFEIMPENLAMPDCAIVTSTATRDYDHATEQYGEYKVEQSWKELYELYKDFLENNEYAITDKSKFESGGKIYAKKDLKIFIVEFKEGNDGMTKVWLNERTEKTQE